MTEESYAVSHRFILYCTGLQIEERNKNFIQLSKISAILLCTFYYEKQYIDNERQY